MHVMAPESAAPCDDDFLLVPHNNLAEVRLPSDAVPGTACITACITEIVVYTVLTLTTTPSGASRLRASLCSSLPLRPRSRPGVFRRREGPSSLPISGHPFLARLALFWFPYEATPHAEVRRRRTSLRPGPFSLLHCLLLPCPVRLFAKGVASGADGRSSRLRSSSCLAIVFFTSSFLPSCSTGS